MTIQNQSVHNLFSNRTDFNAQTFLQSLHVPQSDSHKGQNGKLLIIGGSDLFHAASAWSLTVASRIVDMVFYSSVVENNELIHEAKKHFWDGVVVPRGEIESYIGEADVVLIGPGMTRAEQLGSWTPKLKHEIDWEHDTFSITNYLLSTYPQKKWVIDAGALQMVDPSLLRETMIVTPHTQEFERVFGTQASRDAAINMSQKHHNATIVLKGATDVITNGNMTYEVTGGNEGMTKGGTGDVLAGLIAALYCLNDAQVAAVSGSILNKRAGDALYQTVGPFFNASDLANEIPKVMKKSFVIENNTSVQKL